MEHTQLIKSEDNRNKIYTLRTIQVMIDRDVAELYGVKTKVLNQAVKRNSERFPETFLFQVSDSEKNELVTNCDRFASLKHSSAKSSNTLIDSYIDDTVHTLFAKRAKKVKLAKYVIVA